MRVVADDASASVVSGGMRLASPRQRIDAQRDRSTVRTSAFGGSAVTPIALAVALAGCAEAAPKIVGPSASDSASMGFSDSLPPGGGPGGVAAASSATARLPAMPVGVVECGPSDGADFGDWAPTVEDVERAIVAAGDRACLASALRIEAVRACVARVGRGSVRISTDDLKGPSGCEVTIHGARESTRRWIVFSTFHRENNAQFWGQSTSVELTPGAATLYLSSLVPEQAPLCPDSGATGDVAPKDMPAGWTGLTGSLHAFLCSGK